MSAKKSGLGRGIDSIFLDNEFETTPEGGVKTLRISQIDPTATQPRKAFDQEALAGLADSIAAHGVLQPILVREVAPDRYAIVAGERRWRAAKLAALSEIPAIVVEMDERTAAEVALIENIQREDLNPIEEAEAYETLAKEYRLTQEEIASRVGKSRSAIANTMRLLDLPTAVRAMVIAKSLSAGHARALLGLLDPEMMLPLAEKAVALELSVRDMEDEVRRANRLVGKAEEEEPAPAAFRVDYVKELERKMTSHLGRKVKLATKGAKKSVTLYFEDNEDLEELLLQVCGKDFLSELS
ncbi:MAG: ParB/RepB/Spo0J family partition protein [Clostridia bacterium]|nr:ParB/RepB/Spo0J family partition protein [Clostridia bacterium]